VNEILAEFVAHSGVEAAFILDFEGTVISSAFSSSGHQKTPAALSSTLARSSTVLRSLNHEEIAEIDWVFSNGRILVRGLNPALLCLICERSINLQLLSMQLEDVILQIQSKQRSEPRQPSKADIETLKSEMISIAEEMLEEHAEKVVAIVRASGNELENLEQACDQSEKVTRLFIDRKNAREMGVRMRALLKRYH
jgi:predicted regulator of Ras-like GTPase activity (Roadblock/LC7/MglB family)